MDSWEEHDKEWTKSVPKEWLIYLAAFDTMIAALARGDQDIAKGSRMVMVHLHEELMSTVPRHPNKQHKHLVEEASMKDILDFLGSR